MQAACAAAAAATEAKPTIIGVKPNVYRLPGGNNGSSVTIHKNWITLLGSNVYSQVKVTYPGAEKPK